VRHRMHIRPIAIHRGGDPFLRYRVCTSPLHRSDERSRERRHLLGLDTAKVYLKLPNHRNIGPVFDQLALRIVDSHRVDLQLGLVINSWAIHRFDVKGAEVDFDRLNRIPRLECVESHHLERKAPSMAVVGHFHSIEYVPAEERGQLH